MTIINDKYLIDLIDEICCYHETHNDLHTYKKVINIMDSMLDLLEPLDINETEIRETGRKARECGDDEKLISIRKRLNKTRGDLYNSYKLKLYSRERLGRAEALRSLLFPYDEDNYSEFSNSMDYFVMNMENAGISSEIIYLKLKGEWEYFKRINNIN